jgi:2'-5' RNA ligase
MDVYQQLRENYDSFYLGPEGKERLLKGEVKVEKALVDKSLDKASGLNIIIKLPEKNGREIEEKVYQPLKKIIPGQYYYPLSDFHITFLDILPHRDDFEIGEEELKRYAGVLDEFFSGIEPFEIEFIGVFGARIGIGVMGFPVENKLNDYRNQLRNKLVDAGLRNEEERKYRLESAHMSCIRFIKPITPAIGKQLVDFIDQNRQTPITRVKFTSALLNISGRFDKTDKIKVIKEYHF